MVDTTLSQILKRDYHPKLPGTNSTEKSPPLDPPAGQIYPQSSCARCSPIWLDPTIKYHFHLFNIRLFFHFPRSSHFRGSHSSHLLIY